MNRAALKTYRYSMAEAGRDKETHGAEVSIVMGVNL